jgi:beta-glucosidase
VTTLDTHTREEDAMADDRKMEVTRRTFLAAGLAAAGSMGAVASGAPAEVAPAGRAFPKGFLWGAATAAHQVEGNNVNSDLWLLEHMKPSMFAEPSGDACDFYHRYEKDAALAASLGLNAFRFSIEWARIEPEPGFYSRAELDHYRRVIGACREHGLSPAVTFWHFTNPRWIAAKGGWENPETADHFVRFCERAAKHLGDLIGTAATFNEPNIPLLLKWMFAAMPQNPMAAIDGMMKAAARSIGAERFSNFVMGDGDRSRDVMLPAHHRALEAIKSGPGTYPVGVTLAITDDQPVGERSRRDEKRESIYGAWLDAAGKSDYVGVQTYSRARVDEKGDMPPEPGAELTQMGYEFWPESLEQTIRYAAGRAKVPVYVTENGVATEDDTRRVEYIRRALGGVQKCLADGVDVRGYFHWSFLDNFEWNYGYRPRFGLVAVNRETFERTVKPSAKLLGSIARANAL